MCPALGGEIGDGYFKRWPLGCKVCGEGAAGKRGP
jgi:hypothetical protein